MKVDCPACKAPGAEYEKEHGVSIIRCDCGVTTTSIKNAEDQHEYNKHCDRTIDRTIKQLQAQKRKKSRLIAKNTKADKAKAKLWDKLMQILEEKLCITLESKNNNTEEQYWIRMPSHVSGTGFSMEEALDEAYSEAGF